ncbi:hypothetical protein Droror1_Dr00010295 [Drosera rotundifolia]
MGLNCLMTLHFLQSLYNTNESTEACNLRSMSRVSEKDIKGLVKIIFEHKFEPEQFLGSEIDVKGRDFALSPFGAGRRICPGMPLANRMLHLMLGSLIYFFYWKLVKDAKSDTIDMGGIFSTSPFKRPSPCARSQCHCEQEPIVSRML